MQKLFLLLSFKLHNNFLTSLQVCLLTDLAQIWGKKTSKVIHLDANHSVHIEFVCFALMIFQRRQESIAYKIKNNFNWICCNHLMNVHSSSVSLSNFPSNTWILRIPYEADKGTSVLQYDLPCSFNTGVVALKHWLINQNALIEYFPLSALCLKLWNSREV